MLTTKELVSLEVEKLVNQAKKSLNEVKVVALAQAWKILQYQPRVLCSHRKNPKVERCF
jgi:hypothetical protein